MLLSLFEKLVGTFWGKEKEKKTYIKTIEILTLQPQELILYICS